MDFHHKEILKRYARMATGRPFAPVLLNILVTSVCDMRCVHCFFTDELDDKPRKKLQMTTQNIQENRCKWPSGRHTSVSFQDFLMMKVHTRW